MRWVTSVRSICTVFLIFCLLHGVHFHPDRRDFASDSTSHTWTAPTSVDPTSVDAPYSSYAVNSEGTTTLSAPGVYENAWDHLGTIFRSRIVIGSNLDLRISCPDTTAHTWKPTADVDPTSVDAPYSSYAANSVQLSDNTGSNTLSLSGCAATKTCPGVYDNALNDLGHDAITFMLRYIFFD
jgi:hypothetical protein